MRKITFLILAICLSINYGQAQCDSQTVAHYNTGDFPFTSTTGVEVTMGGTNSGILGPYSAFGCSPATIEGNSIRLDPGDQLTLNFSEAISKITLAVGVMNTYENGTITTNNGDPILSSNCEGDLAITGNAFEQVGALASPVITVTIPNGATSITISSFASTQGGGNGVFTVDILDCIEIYEAPCDSQTVAHYNIGDFPFTSTTGVEVTMGGTNSGILGPYSAFGCSPATIEGNSIRLDPGDELILNFSEAITEISLAVGVMNTFENGTITTNNGDPILSSNCEGDLAITGNAFEHVGPLASPVIKVTIPNGATSITISSLAVTQGGGNGVFTVDVLDCIKTLLPACDSETVAHYNMGDFPFTSTTGVEVNMGGTNSGILGPYSAFGCSPATIEGNSIRLDPGDELILNFSEPITEISLAVGVMNTFENGTITTNNGDPILSSNCEGDLAIIGNAFEQVGALASPVIKVSIPAGATSITISSLASTQGGGNGVFTVDVLDCINPGGTLSIEEHSSFSDLFAFPNPSKDFIQISGLTEMQKYVISNVLGAEVSKGIINNNERIDIKNLTNGLYLLKFESGNTLKFIKN